MNFRQTLEELMIEVGKYNQIKDLGGIGRVQKIYSTAHFICLGIRFLGMTHYYYLGRGSGYEGLYQYSVLAKPKYRAVDSYVQYLRKHFKNGKINNIEVDLYDRIIIIRYSLRQVENVITLFWKGRETFFAHLYSQQNHFRIYKSWTKKTTVNEFDGLESNKIFDLFNILGRRREKLERKRPNISSSKNLDDYFTFLEKITSTNSSFKRKIEKKIIRKKEKILKDLKKCELSTELQKLIQNEDFKLTNEKIFEYKSLKIKLDKGINFYQKLDLIYQKIKKLKRGKEILQKRYDRCMEELTEVNSKDYNFRVDCKIISLKWNASQAIVKKGKNNLKNSDFLKIEKFIYKTMKLAVGLNSRSNDYLRNNWGNKNDFWFHLDGYKGAHLVVKKESDLEFDIEDFKIFSSILRDYSKLQIFEIPIIMTRISKIKGIPGTSGKVSYKNAKFLTFSFVNQWRNYVIPC